MITFQQFCEWATCNQLHDWFALDTTIEKSLTEEERTLIYVDEVSRHPLCTRVYYPKEKFFSRELTKEEYSSLIASAIEKQDFKFIKQLKKGQENRQ